MASFTVVPKDAATETETQSDVPAVAPEPQTNHKRRVLVGFVATAALLATGAAVAATKSSTTAQWKNSAGAVSKYATFNSTGCADWETQMISLKNFDTRAKCDEECAKTSSCKYANYQPGRCQAGVEGAGPGSCYLFKDCKMEPNTCWDLTESGSGGSSTTWTETKKTGCANWATLKLKFIAATSKSACEKACDDHNAGSPAARCEAFNFQPSDKCTGEEAGAGGCYLFKAGCQQEAMDCWDLYTNRLTTTATVTTTTTSTTGLR